MSIHMRKFLVREKQIQALGDITELANNKTVKDLVIYQHNFAEMWQIGVDVLPEYRRNGIASALTSHLAVEILKRGKVPFYCCAWSNIRSVRTALRSGFRPAWVQLTSIDTEKVLRMTK